MLPLPLRWLKRREGVYENENKSQSKKAIFLCADGSHGNNSSDTGFCRKSKSGGSRSDTDRTVRLAGKCICGMAAC